MLITHQLLTDYFDGEENQFMVWHEGDTFEPNDSCGVVEYMALFISLSGTITFETNHVVKKADPQQIQVFLTGTDVRIMSISEDYRSVGIVYSRKFWESTLIHTHPFILLARIHSCLGVSEANRKEILNFISYLDYVKKAGRSDNNPVVQYTLNGLFNMVSKIYEQWVTTRVSASRSKLLSRFCQLVFENYRQHREVSFYANSLNVSLTYFSQLVKQATGMTPFRCIEKYLIAKVCEQLLQTDKCVKEIAVEYGFDDTSHFCKYFRKNIGMSPEEFRQSRMSSPDNDFVL